MLFEVGDILLVRGRTFMLSSSIKKMLNSPYSHVAIAVGTHHICEIDAFKKMKIIVNPYPESDYDLLRIGGGGLDSYQKERMQKFLQEQCKTIKGYDWLRILEIVLRKVFKWNLTINDKDRYICSEVIDAAYNHIGIDILPDMDSEDITPADLIMSLLLVPIELSDIEERLVNN